MGFRFYCRYGTPNCFLNVIVFYNVTYVSRFEVVSSITIVHYNRFSSVSCDFVYVVDLEFQIVFFNVIVFS